MAKTYRITISKFVDKQKKLTKGMPSILIDKDIFFELDDYSREGFLLYLYLLTRLDINGQFIGTDKKIIKQAKLPRTTNLEKLLQEIADRVQYEVISVTDLHKTVSKKPRHIKDTRVEEINKKVKKEINNHNLASETSSLAEEKNDLNSLIKLFEPVNQNLQDVYPNTTERSTLKTLLDRHGKAILADKIKSLAKTHGQPFCVTITKPTELKRLWDKHGADLAKLQTNNSRASPNTTVQQVEDKYANVSIIGG